MVHGDTHIKFPFLTAILHSLTTSSYSVILHSLNPAHIHSFKVASVTFVMHAAMHGSMSVFYLKDFQSPRREFRNEAVVKA